MNKILQYPIVDSEPNISNIEEKILHFWKEKSFFELSISSRSANNEFIFYDGPPFANGLPHYGHLLTGFVKDSVARYQTMLGKRVERRFGWDCHGLPAELSAEKELKISGRKQILDFGVDKFNAHCRDSVMQYAQHWQEYVDRQARWVDFENDYKTMDTDYMESVMWVFKQLYDKGLVYESLRVMPYSWACETPLSNFETRLDNSYRERADKSITVKFTLKGRPSFINADVETVKLLAWTTTPWTLPSNLALAVNPSMEYSCMQIDNECLILASSSLGQYKKELSNAKLIATILGKDLVNLQYQPLFDYFSGHENSFVVLKADFVSDGSGTGIVHLAPGFGEDDQLVCAENNIAIVCPVDSRGHFTEEVYDYQNRLVFDTIDDIIIRLKQESMWFKTEQYIHNYPHCWRTDTPLIYKAVPSWYVKVTSLKERMVELNQQINWIPGHIKNGLFGKWIENARDWSVSRNRFWGTPIPIWKSDNDHYPRIDVYGSIEEIERDFGVKVQDLHKPFIDTLTRPNPDDPTGKSKMVRVPDVFDCWFDSGSMPYGQAHYPFENKDKFDQHFPADFIVEYSAQTRGWFYTLFVLSTALFDAPPFLNCICHGVILDEKGQKLSKRLNNYADPKILFKTYGADPLRFLMLSSPVLQGNELLIDKDGLMIRDVIRLSIKPIWNAYKFFTLYANADQITAQSVDCSDNDMDQYILAKLRSTVEYIKDNMDKYDIAAACKAVDNFFEVLNNWYIRRNRYRFWKNQKDQDKINAYNTLYTVLVVMAKASASLLPLLMEEIYIGLVHFGDLNHNDSIHLSMFPDCSNITHNDTLVFEMDKVREICSSALSIRNLKNIRIRQPLNCLTIYSQDLFYIQKYIDLIKDEVNVKNVVFEKMNNEIAKPKIKINFPLVGKRLPHKIKDIIAAEKTGQWEKISTDQLKIAGELLSKEEFIMTYDLANIDGGAILQSSDAIIMLDLEVTQELKNEGLARDLVRFIQQTRKDMDFDISDKIKITVDCDHVFKEAVSVYSSYIGDQTLSILVFEKIDSDRSNNKKDTKIEDHDVIIKLEK